MADIKDGTYTSVWDGGISVVSNCKVNMDTKEVFDIQVVNCVEGLEVLEKEFITIDGHDYQAEQKDDAEDGSFWYE